MSTLYDPVIIRELLESKKIIIFDFDGVIADSINVKADAFATLYKPYGEQIEGQVRVHHLCHGGISRFEKFKHYHKTFLKQDLNEKELEKLCHKFSELVVDQVVASPYIPGVMQFILQCRKNHQSCVINSATPLNELHSIIDQRGLSTYFSALHGSPASKIENLQTILQTSNIAIERCVFFGDATSDFDAARFIGMDFVGIGDTMSQFLEKIEGCWLVLPNFESVINAA